MWEPTSVAQLSLKVHELQRLAEELYAQSEAFPAVNRNAKRVLAALQMMRLALESPEGETHE